jgi:hypothetical protein
VNVTNGDSTAAGLKEGGAPGEVLAWRDVLHEGPVPALAPAALARVRSRFLADATGVPFDSTYRDLRARDAALVASPGEVVLWFEADLYDQLQLVQVLDRLAGARRQVTLVAVGEYPGIAHFGGLGELSGDRLVALRETAATAVDAGAFELARRAWAAFTAPDPSELGQLRGEHSPVLRHLSEAVERLLQEYPGPATAFRSPSGESCRRSAVERAARGRSFSGSGSWSAVPSWGTSGASGRSTCWSRRDLRGATRSWA